MRIIVGLGNPGLGYRRTRHNIGFMVVSALAHRRGIRLRRGRQGCIQGQGRIGREQVVLAKPFTFMNASGVAVAALVRHHDCSTAEVLVICDDVNLDLGRIRLRRGGSAGGHKGLSSIIHHLGTEAFPRLRIGVGRPAEGIDIMSYVLGAFRRGEWREMKEAIERAAQAAETWVYHGMDEAMNRFNQPGPGQR